MNVSFFLQKRLRGCVEDLRQAFALPVEGELTVLVVSGALNVHCPHAPECHDLPRLLEEAGWSVRHLPLIVAWSLGKLFRKAKREETRKMQLLISYRGETQKSRN